MGWTPERIAVIRLNATTLSAAEIGGLLGTSRSAVLGYAHRNGISLAGPDKKPGRPRRAGPGRPKGIKPKTRPASGLRHDHRTRLTAVAARLAGASYTKAARLAGCSPESIMNNWMKDACLVAEARPIAERAIAEAVLVAHRRAEVIRVKTERIKAWNRGIAARAERRHGIMLEAYIETGSMFDAAMIVGVTRQRIHQVVSRYEASHGFVPAKKRGV